MDALLGPVANYGFPMVLAAYLLLRMEKKLDDLAAAIHRLSAQLERPNAP
ncbi:MAG: YvrJ family protein [Desulfotomaculales bacterium]